MQNVAVKTKHSSLIHPSLFIHHINNNNNNKESRWIRHYGIGLFPLHLSLLQNRNWVSYMRKRVLSPAIHFRRVRVHCIFDYRGRYVNRVSVYCYVFICVQTTWKIKCTTWRCNCCYSKKGKTPSIWWYVTNYNTLCGAYIGRKLWLIIIVTKLGMFNIYICWSVPLKSLLLSFCLEIKKNMLQVFKHETLYFKRNHCLLIFHKSIENNL